MKFFLVLYIIIFIFNKTVISITYEGLFCQQHGSTCCEKTTRNEIKNLENPFCDDYRNKNLINCNQIEKLFDLAYDNKFPIYCVAEKPCIDKNKVLISNTTCKFRPMRN